MFSLLISIMWIYLYLNNGCANHELPHLTAPSHISVSLYLCGCRGAFGSYFIIVCLHKLWFCNFLCILWNFLPEFICYYWLLCTSDRPVALRKCGLCYSCCCTLKRLCGFEYSLLCVKNGRKFGLCRQFLNV